MEFTVYKFLSEKKQQVLSKWQLAAFSSYANNDLLMSRKQEDRFSNPIAYTIEKSTGQILEWLIKAENDVDLFTPLEEICKLKAIQDIRPAEAVSFIFSLKQIIREEIADENGTIYCINELWEMDQRIDKVGLLAFNIYSDCRAMIYELKIKEIKRMYGRDAG